MLSPVSVSSLQLISQPSKFLYGIFNALLIDPHFYQRIETHKTKPQLIFEHFAPFVILLRGTIDIKNHKVVTFSGCFSTSSAQHQQCHLLLPRSWPFPRTCLPHGCLPVLLKLPWSLSIRGSTLHTCLSPQENTVNVITQNVLSAIN